jgi:hypothetical protein
MARYFTVKIGTTYLTRDGLISGTPCKVAVPNFDSLIFDKTGSVSVGRDGSPFTRTVDTGQAGVEIDVEITSMESSIWSSLITQIQAAIDADATLDLEISGVPGSYSGAAKARLPKPITYRDFNSSQIRGVLVHLITA